ncbi:uncharacterized protein DNG_05494 [Cephalotrichum gorgonifer]|uniref:DUF6546 domain-containing protein n=1 Tax=Cephalotrichum gorgonifer TaxID=2041049 RepID=A0AAE8SVT9_9PEZI|nr:uncharacterized protein DNG_05494 [Cephalotrichum gorgonifer]
MPTTFIHLPAELRELVLSFLAEKYAFNHDYLSPLDRRPSLSLASYASVCREWRYVLERTTFSSLCVHIGRLDDFARYVTAERRRRVRHILLHVRLPPYPCDPCTEKESWAVQLENNGNFTKTVCRFFEIMNEWEPEEVCPGGVSLEMSVSSPSDFRNMPFPLWESRRWNMTDIGDRRFLDSALDFIGQDEEARVVGLLRPAYAVTSFTAGAVGRRTIVPGAYGEIISALPCVRQVSLTLSKEQRLLLRNLYFSQFGGYIVRWPPALESLILRGQNNTEWRALPHEVASEKDCGEKLCLGLRNLSPHIRHLSIRDLIKIRELLGPVWPASSEDRGIVPLNPPDLPVYKYLETVDFHYASFMYKSDWYKDSHDFNDQEVTRQWRQNIAFSAARLAMYMPSLRRMTISQRPTMWAGKHRLRYEVGDEGAEIVFSSSFEFKPLEWVLDAWAAVAKRDQRILQVRMERVAADPKDGPIPVVSAVS